MDNLLPKQTQKPYLRKKQRSFNKKVFIIHKQQPQTKISQNDILSEAKSESNKQTGRSHHS